MMIESGEILVVALDMSTSSQRRFSCNVCWVRVFTFFSQVLSFRPTILLFILVPRKGHKAVPSVFYHKPLVIIVTRSKDNIRQHNMINTQHIVK